MLTCCIKIIKKKGRSKTEKRERENQCLVCYAEFKVNLLIIKNMYEWTKTKCNALGQLNKIKNSIYKPISDFNRLRKNTSDNQF